jgi:heterogeneous nuclear rnp K-like protein 2
MSADDSLANQVDGNDLPERFARMGTSDSHGDGENIQRTEEEYAQEQLTLRAIISSKEAGVIIGKAGKNVADLRDETGVRAGVSKVVPGVHDRVLTVTGSLAGIAKAYRMVAKSLLEGVPQVGMGGIISNNGGHGACLLLLPTTSWMLTVSQPSVSSSPTTRWAPSSAARA